MDENLKTILTILGTLLSGAAAAKYVEWRSQKDKHHSDDLTLLRKELREDNQALETRLDAWRDKYFALRDEMGAKVTRLEFENIQLKERIVALEKLLAGKSHRREPRD